MTINNIGDFLKLIERFENPIAWAIAGVLILFLIWRKFTTTEYVTAGKAAMESLNKLCDQLQEENELIKKQLNECRATTDKLRKDIKKLKSKLNTT